MNGNEHSKKERISTATKKKLFLNALSKSMGIINAAMQAAGVQSRATIKNWRDKDPKFDSAMRECESIAGDYVETQLFKRIQSGDTTAIIFYCKTKLKDRGFSERTELTGKDGKDLFLQKTDEELNDEIEELKRKLE